jgi:hypothetical protein
VKWRKPALDPQVRGQLDLRPKERILAWVDDGAGRLIVASETALHLQRVPPEYARIGWDRIEHASYEAGTLTVTLTPDLDSAVLRVPVGEDRDLPVVVRDRVSASVVVDRFEPLDGEVGVRIVGRRVADGSITWRTDLDPTLVGRPDVEDAARRALAEARAEVGDA